MRKILVIGGGLTGLTTAWSVKRQLEAHGVPFSLALWEALPSLGGTLRTRRERGYLWETGPNGWLDRKREILELVREVGLESAVVPGHERAHRRYVLIGGRLRLLPHTPGKFLLSDIISWRGKLRLLVEPFIQRLPAGDITVAEFVTRRLGREALERLIDPMVAGIYAGNPHELSLPATFPRIAELEREHGSLIRALFRLAWTKRKNKAAMAGATPGAALGTSPGTPVGSGNTAPKDRFSVAPRGALLSLRGGMGQLISELEKKLAGVAIRKDLAAGSLRRVDQHWEVATVTGNRERFTTVVLAVPAYRAAALLRDVSPDLSRELGAIAYASISVVALGYRSPSRPLDAYGFLVPSMEKRKIIGNLWDSSIFPERAPEGSALLRVFIGGRHSPHLALLPPPQLIDLAREEVGAILGMREEPELSRGRQYPQAIPQYPLGHLARLERIVGLLPACPGLFLAGNAYHGISMNDCVISARKAADDLCRFLATES